MATEQPILNEILRVRLSGKTYKLLNVMAADDYRDMSTLARRIIEEWLENNSVPSQRKRAKQDGNQKEN